MNKKKCTRGCEGPNVPCTPECDPDRKKDIPILDSLGGYWKWYK